MLGFALMLAVARVDYSRFRELRVGLYTAMMASIILVLLLGQATRGSRRWIELPFFTFQPSELGKVLLITALAGFAIDRGRRINDRQQTARLLLMGFVPALIVFMQPDLGTAIMYVVITLAILFVVGVRWTHFALLGALLTAAVTAVLVIAPAIGHPVLKGYQQERLTSFLNPSSDPRDATYQIDQSLIAIGSGGKAGRGTDSTQTENGFVPDRTTDFIFSVVGERFGFVGAAFVLSLYALLIWRALRIMTLSKNLYGSLIAGGDRRDVHVPGVREHRRCDRHHAGNRHPATFDELWRLVRRRHADGGRAPAEHLRPSAAHLQEQGGSAQLSGFHPLFEVNT